MARSPFTMTVIDNAGNARAGANVTIRRRSDSALATVYAAETGTGPLANPLATDTLGRIAAWLDRGGYRADVSGTGITAYSVPFDSNPPDTDPAAAPPIGAVSSYVGAADPSTSWLVADGRALGRAAYSVLYGLIGTTFGAGAGTSTFNLPNPASRVPLYAGTGSGLTARARGQAGGEEAHILSESEGPIGWVGDDRGNQATSLPLSLGDGYFTLEINTGGGGHNNMPPFIVLGPAIIRVL
jgi:hypothetical protein